MVQFKILKRQQNVNVINEDNRLLNKNLTVLNNCVLISKSFLH